jgi:hypothetical protein
MAHLYVTTDTFEAETLIEDTNPGEKPKHNYHSIKSKSGVNLAKRLGFNPMCSVEINENVFARELESIATRLVKEGLFVAVESGGSLKRYVPKDMKIRDELVKLALRKEKRRWSGEDPCCTILRYSNNPDKIRTFYNQFY